MNQENKVMDTSNKKQGPETHQEETDTQSELRSVHVAARLTPSEHNELVELANSLGLDLANLVRSMIYHAKPDFEKRRARKEERANRVKVPKTEHIAIRVSGSVHHRLLKMAEEKDQPLSALVREIVMQFLKEEEQKEACESKQDN